MKKIFTLVATLLATASASGVGAEETLTVASWGGSYQDAQREAMFKPTEKELGIKIRDVTLSGLADVRVQVRSGAVTWDVVDLGVSECALGAQQGLFEPLDYKVIEADGIDENMVGEDWVGVIYYSTVIARNTETAQKMPQNWAEFWDTKNFPGPRAMRNHPAVQMEAALLADGVEPDNLYPLDVDRAFEKLAEIKPDISTWWSSGAQGAQVVSSGEVDYDAAWDGRLYVAQQDGAPIDYHFSQGILNADCLAVPKGAPHKELAMKAIARFLSPDQQAAITRYIPYGPINQHAFDDGRISEETAARINTSPDNISQQVAINPQWWGENGQEMQERWDSFLQR